MKPFGPVDNGQQSLYGLDYKTAMWRDDEENPFHTEVGYWLWDAATNEVMRGFVVPRGITDPRRRHRRGRRQAVLDGRQAGRDERLQHRREHVPRVRRPSTMSYEVTVTINDDGTWSYQESTILRDGGVWTDAEFAHTDTNTLKRVG